MICSHLAGRAVVEYLEQEGVGSNYTEVKRIFVTSCASLLPEGFFSGRNVERTPKSDGDLVSLWPPFLFLG